MNTTATLPANSTSSLLKKLHRFSEDGHRLLAHLEKRSLETARAFLRCPSSNPVSITLISATR